MSNIIAVIWDFDKTLIDGYMQEPLFEEYNLDSKDFWSDVNEEIKQLTNEGKKVNKDTYYLNYFIKKAQNGEFPGLNNEKLKSYGEKLEYYKGIPEIFEKTKHMLESDSKSSYADFGIKVEHYIVSTGFAETIRGTKLMPFVESIWGCELNEKEINGEKIINEILYTIDNTTKTRAIFEINKGIGKLNNIDVNSKIDDELRRVRFENMIYIADGPSDIPAFSLIKKNNGNTFAVYPKGKEKEMKQAEKMREDGRIDMYAEADYSEQTTAYLWITSKIQEIADKILKEEKDKIEKSASSVPQHII